MKVLRVTNHSCKARGGSGGVGNFAGVSAVGKTRIQTQEARGTKKCQRGACISVGNATFQVCRSVPKAAIRFLSKKKR